jgi:hypothetical protein
MSKEKYQLLSLLSTATKHIQSPNAVPNIVRTIVFALFSISLPYSKKLTIVND